MTAIIDRLRYAPASFWRCVAVCGVALAVLYAVTARARDASGHYADSPYAEWFKSQHNEKGEWCCDKSDGHYYDGAYTLNPNGSVTIGSGKDAETLPSYMVLKHPNPTGRAVWWYLDTTISGHVDYCFAPGTLS
jgi:hypothetical protein